MVIGRVSIAFALTINGASASNDKTATPCIMSPQFWLGLQMDYDLDVAEDELGERLDREIIVLAV